MQDIELVINSLSTRHINFTWVNDIYLINMANKLLTNLQTTNWEDEENWIDESLKTEKYCLQEDIVNVQGHLIKFIMGSLIKNWLTTFIHSRSNNKFITHISNKNDYQIIGPFNIGMDAPGVTFELHKNENLFNNFDYHNIISYSERCNSGKTSLVLGAGNQNFLSIIDILERIFVHRECVLFKHHPLRPFLYAPYYKLLKEVIDGVLDNGFNEAV